MLNHDWTRNAISIRMYSAETNGPIFTKISHNIMALVALFNRAYTRRYPIPFLYARMTKVQFAIFGTKLVALAKSLEISEKEVQIDHRHVKRSYMVNIAKIGPVNPDIFDEIRRSTLWTRNAISIRMFSSKTTGPIFTKILHDIVALFNHAYKRHYPITFLNTRAMSEGGRFWRCQNAPKLIGYYSNVP